MGNEDKRADATNNDTSRRWEEMSQSELTAYALTHQSEEHMDIFIRYVWLAEWRDRLMTLWRGSVGFLAKIVFRLIHWSARAAGQPLVDLGHEYSAEQINERILQLEVLMVNQWTNLKDTDFSTPDQELKKYIAACHVVGQYDRINTELLRKRLDISESAAAEFITQLIADEVITEPYTEVYYDVRRSAVDEVLNRTMTSLHKQFPKSMPALDKRRKN